jgi:hypothetical protein
MSVEENRIRNLQRLTDRKTGKISKTDLAAKLGHAQPSFLSSISGPHPTRSFTAEIAREIESVLRLPPLILDRDQAYGSRSTLPRSERIAEIVDWLERATDEQIAEIEHILAIDLF